MPGKDQKAVEVKQLQTELEKIKNQIKDARNTNERLRSEAEFKIQTIKKIETEFSEKQEVTHQRRERALQRRKQMQDEANIKIDAIKREQRECIVELSRCDLSQQEYDRLDAKLREIATQYIQEDNKMTEQIETRQKRSFDLKMSMDETFRKMLAQFDIEQKEIAYANIKKEVTEAKEKVNQLYKSSGKREKECMDVIRLQQNSYEKLLSEKVNLDVLTTTTNMQEQLSWKIYAAVNVLKEEIQLQLDRGRRIAKETEDIIEIVSTKQTLLSDIKGVQDTKVKIVKAREDTEKRCIQLCSKLIRTAIKIAEQRISSHRNELVERFTGIIDLEVEREEGSALIVEKSRASSSDQDTKSLTEMDTFNYDAIWKIDSTTSHHHHHHRRSNIPNTYMNRNGSKNQQNSLNINMNININSGTIPISPLLSSSSDKNHRKVPDSAPASRSFTTRSARLNLPKIDTKSFSML